MNTAAVSVAVVTVIVAAAAVVVVVVVVVVVLAVAALIGYRKDRRVVTIRTSYSGGTQFNS